MAQEPTVAQLKRHAKIKLEIKKFLAYIFLAVGAIAMVAPFLWMITTSLKEPGEVFSYQRAWWHDWIPLQFV